jgi:hypothetical protein
MVSMDLSAANRHGEKWTATTVLVVKESIFPGEGF